MPHLDEGEIQALLDRELAPEQRAEAEAHLATCPPCRALFEEARAFAAGADALIRTIDLPPGTARPLPGLHSASGPRPGRHYRGLAWAATLVLAAGLGYLASDHRYGRPPETVTDLTEAKPTPATVPTESLQPSSDSRMAEKAGAQPPAAPPHPSNRPRQEQRRDVGSTSSSGGVTSESPRLEESPAVRTRERRNETAAAQFGDASIKTATTTTDSGSGLRLVTMEEAIRLLGGSIRLIDGLTPAAVLAGPGSASALDEPDAAVAVRVVYPDAPGRELWLDQARPQAGYAGKAAAPTTLRGQVDALLPGDTVLDLRGGGPRTVRWLDASGFRLALTGRLPGDSLRALGRRVR